MSQVGKAIAAGLAGALVSGLDEYAKNKIADKQADKAADADAKKKNQPVTPNAPSYTIPYKMRQDEAKPSDDATE
jgi:hypothetical protein